MDAFPSFCSSSASVELLWCGIDRRCCRFGLATRRFRLAVYLVLCCCHTPKDPYPSTVRPCSGLCTLGLNDR